MYRREFLRLAALAPASLPSCALRGQDTQAGPSQRARAAKRGIVIGAGLAGLVAGYELTESGHDVTGLEARTRPGGDVTAPGWPGGRGVEKLDGMSAAEFLRARGASPGAISLLRVGYLDRIGDGIETYSALLMLCGLALRRTEKARYAIKGGTDLLP